MYCIFISVGYYSIIFSNFADAEEEGNELPSSFRRQGQRQSQTTSRIGPQLNMSNTKTQEPRASPVLPVPPRPVAFTAPSGATESTIEEDGESVAGSLPHDGKLISHGFKNQLHVI